jgi:hypothetical protein
LAPVTGRILERLLVELAGTRLHELACDRFAAWLAALPAQERARLSAVAAEKRQVDVTSADGVLSTQVQTAIQSLLSVSGPLSAREDPQLIAGVRLRVGETVIDGSLQAQIARIMKQASERGNS